VYPPRVRALIARYVADELPEIPVAYPTDWGVAGTGELTGLRLDVYFEVALGTLVCTAQALGGSSSLTFDSVRTALRRVHRMWHVNGIDNAFYFAVLWPAVYLAMGLMPEQIAGAVVNEFYTLDGAKFSTSRGHAIWADEFLAGEDAELVRLYLAWDRPDRSSSDFTDNSYRAFTAHMRALLDGGGTVGCSLPEPLLKAELDRAERALEPAWFDPALAVRGLMVALGAGAPTARLAALRGAIAGLDRE
jgi:methionyl-tRNA synthetase